MRLRSVPSFAFSMAAERAPVSNSVTVTAVLSSSAATSIVSGSITKLSIITIAIMNIITRITFFLVSCFIFLIIKLSFLCYASISEK